jgi:hypothetical protein
MVNIIKKIALASVKNSNPVELKIGEVVGLDPFGVEISDKLILTENNLIFGERMPISGKMLAHHHHDVIVDGFSSETGDEIDEIYSIAPIKIGDKLALLRVQGGGQYFVLDRVAGGEG